jgi:excisionase family DNA binding protein
MAETVPKDLLTITEAVAKFSLPESTIRLWIRNGRITKHKRRGSVLVNEADLQRELRFYKPRPSRRKNS